jgi:hypothetical protein
MVDAECINHGTAGRFVMNGRRQPEAHIECAFLALLRLAAAFGVAAGVDEGNESE